MANTTPFTPLPDRISFELPGQSPGVLLVHGFTGDTREMRPLAEQLNALGLYCYAPLLPGHGVPPHLLHGITDDDYLHTVRQALDRVRARHDQVIVCGFSMGAALSAIILERDARAILGFAAIAPMILIRNPLLPLAPFARHLLPWFYPLRFMSIDVLGIREELLAYDPTLNLDDPEVLEQLKREVRFPVGAAAELGKIANRAAAAAHHLTLPTLVIQGEADLTLKPAGAERFYRSLPAKDKTYLTFAGADHDLVKPRNIAHREVLAAVTGWIRAHFLANT